MFFDLEDLLTDDDEMLAQDIRELQDKLSEELEYGVDLVPRARRLVRKKRRWGDR